MVTGVIGKGGSASVYKANDILLNRTVALKILEDDKSELRLNTRSFETEVKAIARLSHPNIVNVYDISMDGSIKYIVMECVEGITLSTYLKHKKVLHYSEVVSCARQVLRALKEAHEKGIVHRDIKPQNIMIMKNGQIKVADFGIARLPDKDSFAMQDRSIGTVHYISPEQARGNSVDPRSDLYSLAIVMYEMATGVRPFEAGAASEVIVMQVTNTPVRPIDINPAIPKELDGIIMRALSKRPENRYESSSEMMRALERVGSGEQTEDEERATGKGGFGFFKRKKEKEPSYDVKEKSETQSEEEALDEIRRASPKKLSEEEKNELYEEIDDAEEGVYFTSPFETDDVNESLQSTADAEKLEEENDEPDEIEVIDVLPEKLESAEAAGMSAVSRGEMNLVPTEQRFPIKYVIQKQPRYRIITAAVISFLLLLSCIAVGFLVFENNKKYEVPFYTSMKLDNVMEETIFSLQVKREHSLVYPKDAIIAQSVEPGKKLRKGSEILLTISDGPISVYFDIPRGNNVDTVKAQLIKQIEENDYKISIVTKYEYSAELPAGECFEIKEQVLAGGVLTLRVSAGDEKQYAEIPDFVGKPLDEAVSYLEEKNVVFEILYSDAEGSANIVLSQSIEAGRKTEAFVSEGKISLTVGGRGN